MAHDGSSGPSTSSGPELVSTTQLTQLPKVYKKLTSGDSFCWFFKYSDPHLRAWFNKQVPHHVQDELEARCWAHDWLVANGSIANITTPTKTLAILAPKWLELIKANGGDAVGAKKWFERHVLPHQIASIDLTQLSVPDVVKWVNALKTQKAHRRDTPLAPLTVRNIIAGVRGMVTDIRGNGWANMPTNPFADEYIKKVHKNPSRRSGRDNVNVSVKQARVLVNVKDQMRRVRYVLALTTGMRASEIQALDWAHVDFENNVIHVERQLKLANVKNGKRRRGKAVQFADPKRGSERFIPICSLLKRELLAWREVNQSNVVFPHHTGAFTRNVGHSASLKDDLEQAGLAAVSSKGHPLRFHSTRSFFATELTNLECPVHIVKQLMGHAASGVTFANYVSREVDRCRPWVKALSALLEALPENKE